MNTKKMVDELTREITKLTRARDAIALLNGRDPVTIERKPRSRRKTGPRPAGSVNWRGKFEKVLARGPLHAEDLSKKFPQVESKIVLTMAGYFARRGVLVRTGSRGNYTYDIAPKGKVVIE